MSQTGGGGELDLLGDGDDNMGQYMADNNLTVFGRRRGRPRGGCRRAPRKRQINSKSVCNRLKRKVCRSTPGCSYVRGRKIYGCRRKSRKSTGTMMPPGFTSGSTPGSIRDPLFDYDFTRPPAVGVSREVVAGSAFGRRRRCKSAPRKRRINSKSPCNRLKKKDCKAKPGCGYVSSRKRYGCKRKPIYASAFGRRRGCKSAPAKRRINSKSPCNKLKRKVCRSTPGCGYVSGRKRYGCKRKPIYTSAFGF
jgi:hypothetical protein